MTRFIEGAADDHDDVGIRRRFFTRETPEGLVAGTILSVTFTIGRPAAEVWEQLKDFNRWQNPSGYHYSGVVGELEGGTFAISTDPDRPNPPYYEVLKVIPEHMIVLSQPVPADGSSAGVAPGHGSGGISPGFHTFMLTERLGSTIATIVMEHAFRTRTMTADEAIASMGWSSASEQRWRDGFIPTLKKLVHDGS